MASTSTLDRWEKDPFFAAAEEVQDSADRMESLHRRWIREKKRHPKPDGMGDGSGEAELRRELQAALGTAKWQLEEFDRASLSSGPANEADDDSRTRHNQFAASIGNQIRAVEDSLRKLEIENGRTPLVWVRLDEGERDELVMFLSDPQPAAPGAAPSEGQGLPPLAPGGGVARSETKCINREVRIELREAQEERKSGHRRAASVGANLGAWKSSVSDEERQRRSPNEPPETPPPRVVSFSGLSAAAESTWRSKWKCSDHHQASDSIPLKTNQFGRGLKTFYERSKSCLSDCGDESCEKQLDGCFGNFQRQLQRSQYQIQYSRPIQLIFSMVLAFLLIVVFTLRAM